MNIYNFDIKISERILKTFKTEKLKYFSLFSDFLLLFYCIFLIYISLQNVIFIFLGWIIPNILQKFFKKERPYSFFKLNINYDTPKERSFPSSHTFLAMFLFFRIVKIHLILAILIIIIPVLRILSLQHWFSDVIFSIMLSSIFYIFISAFI